jgi:hypothetical protein
VTYRNIYTCRALDARPDTLATYSRQVARKEAASAASHARRRAVLGVSSAGHKDLRTRCCRRGGGAHGGPPPRELPTGKSSERRSACAVRARVTWRAASLSRRPRDGSYAPCIPGSPGCAMLVASGFLSVQLSPLELDTIRRKRVTRPRYSDTRRAGVAHGPCTQGLLSPEGRRVLGALSWVVFNPALIFVKLGSTLTPARLLHWWPLIVNTGISTLVGLALGFLGARLVRPPEYLRQHTVVAIALGKATPNPQANGRPSTVCHAAAVFCGRPSPMTALRLSFLRQPGEPAACHCVQPGAIQLLSAAGRQARMLAAA